MTKTITIEDHVVPQLLTSAIEAYEIEHKAHKNGKAKSKLETFGLLWGYSIPQKGNLPDRIVATMATVETSALRHEDWVSPNFASIKSKKSFFEKYWPNIELVGTFHSHPYENLSEVNEFKGWRASEGDIRFFPSLHQELAPNEPNLAHLIVTITKLEKKGWALPERLKGKEEQKGYVLSADDRKLWLRAYSSKASVSVEGYEPIFEFCDDVCLEIPALQNRFW